MGNLRTITIVGGGLAGLTLGIGLRRQGIPVTIWEAGHYPRHRVCGEFISGRGQETLARLGLCEQLIQAGAITSNTAMFLSGNAKSPARSLPQPALCLSRFVLDARLAKVFRDLGGELRENERWRESELREGIVRASGRRAQVASNGWHWFGLKVHVRNLPLQADLEMHAIEDGYVGLTRLPNDEVDVCGLFRRPSNGKESSIRGAVGTPHPTIPTKAGRGRQTQLGFPTAPKGGLPRGWQEALAKNSAINLCTRISDASFDETSTCSVAGLSLRPLRAADLSELCIGDALTMTPPVTGNGMSMAFESAELAIEPLVSYSQGKLDWPQTHQTIAQACDRAFSRRLAWARWLQWMMFAPMLKGPMAALVLRSNLLWQMMFANTR
jgi:2-polyprenyl-6-methoxyphenol hydroxylase-like FAD-dependent oxidoreductase